MSPFSIPAMLGGGSVTPWLLVGVLVLLIATNGVTGYEAYEFGQNSVRIDWEKEKAERARKALEATNQFNVEKAVVEQAARDKIAAIDTESQRQLQQKEKENAKLRRDVTTGATRLSVPGECPRTVTIGVGVGGRAAPATSGLGDGATRVELQATTSLDLISLADDADRNTDQLRDAQKVIATYYEQCGPARK